MIPATYVPSERLFSKAGDIIYKKQKGSSVKSSAADQSVIFMHKNVILLLAREAN